MVPPKKNLGRAGVGGILLEPGENNPFTYEWGWGKPLTIG